jgi:septal ring factor EnvC (AmiA/AmiB activator)
MRRVFRVIRLLEEFFFDQVSEAILERSKLGIISMSRCLIGAVCLGALGFAAPTAYSILRRVDTTIEHLSMANKHLMTANTQLSMANRQLADMYTQLGEANRQLVAANRKLDVTQVSVTLANSKIDKTNEGLVQTINELGETNKSLAKTNAKLSMFDNVFQKISLLNR